MASDPHLGPLTYLGDQASPPPPYIKNVKKNPNSGQYADFRYSPRRTKKIGKLNP